MLTWFKKQTLAFFVACILIAPIALLLLYLLWWIVFSPNSGAGLLLFPGVLIINGIVDSLFGWLLFGIYRKKRLALTLSVIVFPLLWLSATGGLYVGSSQINVLLFSLSVVIAFLIACVYLRELARNKQLQNR